MVYTGIFSGIKHARNFASKHGSGGGYNSSEKTSATWTPSGVGGRAKVTIDKGRYMYDVRKILGPDSIHVWMIH